jgi:putative transcription antitermination factor YqgF
LARVAEWVTERQPEAILVGVPTRVGDDGAPHLGQRARRSMKLIERLRQTFPDLAVIPVDEAHSTDEAHARLKTAGIKAARRRRLDDAIAALVILERYLDS